MDKGKKILVISHGHPDISKGGAEVASYNLFTGLRDKGFDATYLARTDLPPHGGSMFSAWKRKNEVLMHLKMDDYFIFLAENKEQISKQFNQFLKQLNPEIVHFHHYIHMGLEFINEVKHALPKSKIILTLHEYMAICPNNGQMVKVGKEMKLCYSSSPVECATCFPERNPTDILLRKLYISSFFEIIDHFVSPSHFLIDRYVDWGLPKEKITMIENGQPFVDITEFVINNNKEKVEKNSKGKFAFFGQLNPFKGIDVLLEAFVHLDKKILKEVHLDIFGANLEMQAVDFQIKIKHLMKELGSTLTFHGAYESRELPELMKNVDWVIIPSVWWENSPMVIQEAFNHKRPLIGSDIGGMKEKIAESGGLLFRNRSSVDLARTITKATEPKVWSSCVDAIKEVLTTDKCVDEHLKTYKL